MMPDHTRQAPLLSHDAMSLWGPGSMHRDTTAPSCPAHCTPAAHQAESVARETYWSLVDFEEAEGRVTNTR